jgi:hypothetical protein
MKTGGQVDEEYRGTPFITDTRAVVKCNIDEDRPMTE